MINNSFSKKYGFMPDSCQPGLSVAIDNRYEMCEWIHSGVGGGGGSRGKGWLGKSGYPSAAVHRPPRSHTRI